MVSFIYFAITTAKIYDKTKQIKYALWSICATIVFAVKVFQTIAIINN